MEQDATPAGREIGKQKRMVFPLVHHRRNKNRRRQWEDNEEAKQTIRRFTPSTCLCLSRYFFLGLASFLCFSHFLSLFFPSHLPFFLRPLPFFSHVQWISVLANFKGNAFHLARSGVRGRRLRKRSAKRRRRQWRRKRAITQRQSSSIVV